MSTAATTTTGGETTSSPNISWNAIPIGRDTNRVALQWGFERIPRLIELGYRHTHGWVLVALAKRSKLNGDNKVWPVPETIAAEIGMKPRSVIYALDELEAGGVISTDKVPGRNQNRYEILPEGQQHAWKAWISCKPCNVARGAALHSVQDKVARGASSMLHSVQDNVASGATEQEKVTGAVEEEKITGEQTDGGGQKLKRSVDLQDMGKAKTTPATPKTPILFGGPANPTPAKKGPSPAASAPSSHPAAITSSDAFPPTAPGKLAQLVWETIGAPRRERPAAQALWPARLQEHVDRDGGAGLLRILTAAMLTEFYGTGNADHPAQLPRFKRSEDSLDYILGDLDNMVDGLLREEKKAQRKAAAAPAASTDTSTRTSSARKWLNFDAEEGE